MQVADVASLAQQIKAEFAKVIVGKDDIIEAILVALLTGGHVLLEGVPGTSKTLLARTLSRLLGLHFNRIQFTPDLMPSDILGTNIYQIQSSSFQLVKGPIFADFLLADEINRSPAKTQAALLEAMEERQVTIDGIRHPLSEHFMVFATQNPIEQEGTYPLPEAQLDRFLFKLLVTYPSPSEEDEILRRVHQGFDARSLHKIDLSPIAQPSVLLEIRSFLRTIAVSEPLLHYIRQIIHATRQTSDLLVGASPRASIFLLLTSKSLAALRGRDFVTPDDIKLLCPPILRHRLIVSPDLEIEGLRSDDVIQKIISSIPVPR